MSFYKLEPHDPDVCRYCKALGLTKDDWTKAMGGNRDE